MTVPFFKRSLKVLSSAALWAAISTSNAWADPIVVTSGVFGVGARGPAYIQFFGADGFTLRAFFLDVPTSPSGRCGFAGCAAGSALDMSVVAGGESASTRFTLGRLIDANIGGVRFGEYPPTTRLAGILRFDAPTVMLPSSANAQDQRGLPAPFLFNGTVSAFAAHDLEAAAPLFQISLVGQGRTWITFDEFDPVKNTFVEPQTTYEFSATPEPASLALLGTGLTAVVARSRLKRRRG